MLLIFASTSCESKTQGNSAPKYLIHESSKELQTYNEVLKNFKLSSTDLEKDTIDATKFNVVADYNGRKGTDNRYALQLAIDYCSANNKVLKLPKGKIYVNSYGLTPSAKAHANIIELKSNTNIIGNDSEIVVGAYFLDKAFVLLSGLNAVEISEFSELKNISIKNISFNFNNTKVYMVSNYQLMRGIELGHLINGEVSNCTFFNGDLTAAIITGQGNKDISKNVKIHDNKFINLIKSEKNQDHTSVYLNSQNSSIYNNVFTNTSKQGKIVACAGELHNSNTSFYNNSISGYLRMNFVAAQTIENHNIKNLSIYNNTARLTSAGIYLWTEDNTSISDIVIRNNHFFSSHIDGYTMFYNGTQGILGDSRVGKNAKIINLTVENNKTNILKTIIKGRAVNFMLESDRVITNFVERNNICNGCTDGKYYQSGFRWPF